MTITKGIYICANEPTEPSADMFLEPGSFTSNNENACFEIQYNATTRKLYYNTFGDDSYEVYNYATKTWTNNAWKTIDIASTNSAGNDWFFANYTRQQLSIDLTTLPGWANLSSGNHTIKIKAKGTGYRDSELSAGVVVSKAASTVTLEAGTYKWKDTTSLPNTNIIQSFDFTSKPYNSDTDFEKVTIETSGYIRYSTKQSSLDSFYREPNGDWVTQDAEGETEITIELQTITLSTDQQVSAEFYKWSITDGNLVKQAAGETWVLNDSDALTESNQDFTSLNFTSDSQSFVRILRQYNNSPIPPVNSLLYYKSDGTYVTAVYTNDDGIAFWNRQAYRTLTFATPPTGDLLTWLQANGTKQAAGYNVTVTYSYQGSGDWSGLAYYSTDDGATWIDLYDSTNPATKTIENITQIKFKSYKDSVGNYSYISGSGDLSGISFGNPWQGTDEVSANVVLTQNSSVNISYGD